MNERRSANNVMAKVPRGFGRFLLRGAALLKNPRLLKQMLTKAVSKLGRAEGGPLSEVKEQLQRLIALLKAYVSGEYREVSTQTMVTVAAAIVYFVVPFDGIPDFLFGWGLVDDAAVISYVVAQLSSELEAFAVWQEAQEQDVQQQEVQQQEADKQDADQDKLPPDRPEDDSKSNTPPAPGRCSLLGNFARLHFAHSDRTRLRQAVAHHRLNRQIPRLRLRFTHLV